VVQRAECTDLTSFIPGKAQKIKRFKKAFWKEGDTKVL